MQYGAAKIRRNSEFVELPFGFKISVFLHHKNNSEVIILARLNNGDIHMLGDADRGAEIGENVEASSGKAVTDNNGAIVSFVYDTPPPPPPPPPPPTVLPASPAPPPPH